MTMFNCYTCRQEYYENSIKKGKCPKGHPVKRIAKTGKECPVCNTVPLLYKYGGNNVNPGEYDMTRGRVVGNWHGRDENKPCLNCIKELEHMRAAKKEMEARAQTLTPRSVVSYPYFDMGRAHVMDLRNSLQGAFRELMLATGLPNPTRDTFNRTGPLLPLVKESYSGVNTAGSYLFTEAQASAIQRVFDAVNALMPQVYQEGLDDGRNLLTALLNDEITTTAFEGKK